MSLHDFVTAFRKVVSIVLKDAICEHLFFQFIQPSFSYQLSYVNSLYFQRNPDDYLSRRKAQEEEEKLEKSKYPRRYQKSDTGEKDVTKRRSYYVPRPDDEAQRIARDYRQKRRSLNLDKRSDNTDKSTDSAVGAPHRSKRETNQDRKDTDKPLEISTESGGFKPESASSPRATSPDISKGPKSPRSAVSPPRPSTKRKVAPPPPCSNKSAAFSAPAYISPIATSAESSTPSTQSTAASSKPSTTFTPASDKPAASEPRSNKLIPSESTPKQQELPKPTEPVTVVKPVENTEAKKEQTVEQPQEIPKPSRPPRRKKKSVEEDKFVPDNRKSNDISLTADIAVKKEKPQVIAEADFVKPKQEEDSLFDAVIKELPSLKTEIPVDESAIQVTVVRKEESLPVNKTVITVNGDDSEGESVIAAVKVDKPRGKLLDTDITSSQIEFVGKDLGKVEEKAAESDNEDVVLIQTVPNAVEPDLMEVDAPDGYLDPIKPVNFVKAADAGLEHVFSKILTFEDKQKVKDTKDTISIASDISSAGSEAPPLPDSAPPALPVVAPPTDIQEIVEPITSSKVESLHSEMADTIPEVTEPASPREVSSPISDLKASMFSMRVTSPTTGISNDVKSNGVLTVDVGERRRNSSSDSDLSDDEQDRPAITGTFTPGTHFSQSF